MPDLTGMMAGAFMRRPPEGSLLLAAPPFQARKAQRYSDALILSGGGQWGAYGAGVIAGWTGRGRLPARITTGISTGALQATFAYLGPRHDRQLLDAYAITKESQLVDRHNSWFFLTHASVADTAPLKRFIGSHIAPLLDAVASEHDRSGRALFVGAVDALTGQFRMFDLGAIASTLSGQERNDCYTAALLASSAVPVVFRQITINGRPWLDGGIRKSVLIPDAVEQIAKARRMAARTNEMISTDGRIYALRNGTVAPDLIDELPAQLLPTLSRLRTILFNQVDQDSLDLAAIYAKCAKLILLTTTADGWNREPRLPQCRGQDPMRRSLIFDPSFMACLTAFGRHRWNANRRPWAEYASP